VKPFKLLCFLTALALLLGSSWQAGYALIQPDILLDSVTVQLLPEYLHPPVLVIYEIELDENIALPQELTFDIPGDAEILSVLNFTTQHRPLELDYEQTQLGNWKELKLTTTTHRLRIEYQDPNLVRQGSQRLYEFQWLSIYPVAAFSINVRQPMGASDLETQPPLRRIGEQSNGEAHYAGNYRGIPAGYRLALSFSYTKDPKDSAYPALPVQPAIPIEGATPDLMSSPVTVILWLLVVSVAIVIVVLIYYLWYRSTFIKTDERFVHGVGILNPEKQPYFCHECGMRADPGNSYCGNCGTELRKPTFFDRLSQQ
jgi:hypothetical protein